VLSLLQTPEPLVVVVPPDEEAMVEMMFPPNAPPAPEFAPPTPPPPPPPGPPPLFCTSELLQATAANTRRNIAWPVWAVFIGEPHEERETLANALNGTQLTIHRASSAAAGTKAISFLSYFALLVRHLHATSTAPTNPGKTGAILRGCALSEWLMDPSPILLLML
jgi:hypothetical protein